MSSARDVLEVSRAVLNGKDGWVAVLKAYMDESGTHDRFARRDCWIVCRKAEHMGRLD